MKKQHIVRFRAALEKCFAYARKQFLGMTFQRFSYGTTGVTFVWDADPQTVGQIKRLLDRNKVNAAFHVFTSHVDIVPDESNLEDVDGD